MADNPDAGQQLQHQFSDWQSSSVKPSVKCESEVTATSASLLASGHFVREPVRIRSNNDSLLAVPVPSPNALIPPPPQLSRSYVTLAIPEECTADVPLLRSRFPVRRPDNPTTNLSGGTGPVNTLDVRIESSAKRKTWASYWRLDYVPNITKCALSGTNKNITSC